MILEAFHALPSAFHVLPVSVGKVVSVLFQGFLQLHLALPPCGQILYGVVVWGGDVQGGVRFESLFSLCTADADLPGNLPSTFCYSDLYHSRDGGKMTGGGEESFGVKFQGGLGGKSL